MGCLLSCCFYSKEREVSLDDNRPYTVNYSLLNENVCKLCEVEYSENLNSLFCEICRNKYGVG